MTFDGSLFHYANFDTCKVTPGIDSLFPTWTPGDERVMVLCPHDDDGALGAGYAMCAAQANQAEIYVGIYCDGWAGYSHAEEASTIVARRAAETLAAYAAMNLPASHVIRFNYPDFSLLGWLGWKLPTGGTGTMSQVLPVLRQLRITRLLLPNDYREHIDHQAAYQSGAFDGPQTGDAVLAELGLAPAIRSYAQYAVWSDLSPEDALVKGRSALIRANRAIIAPPEVEDYIAEAVQGWESQKSIIAGIMAARKTNRVQNKRALEVYRVFDPRPPLDYAPYHELLDSML